jgi:large subunit ribosomal protein L43
MGSFTLPCRKVVLEYNDSWVSSAGARDFARSGNLKRVAEQWPSVEMVMLEKPNKHPYLRAFYGK